MTAFYSEVWIIDYVFKKLGSLGTELEELQ